MFVIVCEPIKRIHLPGHKKIMLEWSLEILYSRSDGQEHTARGLGAAKWKF